MKKRVFAFCATLSLAVACSTTQPSLEGSAWSATQINGESVERSEGDDPERFSILFVAAEEEGERRIAAMGACNRIMGHYSASEDGTLSIQGVGSTMMFCPGLELEEAYVDALEQVTRYTVKEDQLTLYQDNEIVVVLERTGAN